MHQYSACGLLMDVDRRAMARLALPVSREASIECNLVTAWPCSGARLNQDNVAIHLHGSGTGMQLGCVRSACDATVCTRRVRVDGRGVLQSFRTSLAIQQSISCLQSAVWGGWLLARQKLWQIRTDFTTLLVYNYSLEINP